MLEESNPYTLANIPFFLRLCANGHDSSYRLV
jgi:hypothetical protein